MNNVFVTCRYFLSFSQLQSMPRSYRARRIMPVFNTALRRRLAHCGEDLGEVCGRYYCDTLSQFTDLLNIKGHPMWCVVQVLNNATLDPRRRFELKELRLTLCSGRRLPLKVKWFLEQCFGFLYSTMRFRAVPRAPQPTIQSSHNVHVPRHLRRNLRQRGVRSLAPVVRASVQVRAEAALLSLWDSMAGRSLVMWFDNFYLGRWTSDPMSENRSINSSVVSVLHLPPLPRFGGHPPISKLLTGCRAACSIILNTFPALKAQSEELLHSSLISRLTIRVPLDVIRSGVQSLQWKPFALTGDVIGTNTGLLSLVALAQTTCKHARSPLPLLIDVDVYLRLIRIL